MHGQIGGDRLNFFAIKRRYLLVLLPAFMKTHHHSPGAFSIAEFLTAAECEALIALAEHAGFAAAQVRMTAGAKSLPRIRNNERVLVESEEWVDVLWQRLCTTALPNLGGTHAVGLPKGIRFYKYLPGQRFKMHKDGPWSENGRTSKLTLLVYLNQDFVGGHTDFRSFQVAPRQGDALVFVHDTWHEGVAVQQGTKYVLRSDILYSTYGECSKPWDSKTRCSARPKQANR